MKLLYNFLGIVCAFCLIFVLLITSVEAVAYWLPGYYEKEYTKYDVTSDVDMKMDDLLDVTHEMMAFLRGNREDLHVMTTMGGVQREFFNEREIAHMTDVKGLFLAAIFIRRICICIIAGCIALFLLLKADIKKILPRMMCVGTGLFFIISVILGLLMSTDFTKYFIIFHKIFFSNDLWLLNPETDMLINIVPEPFFMDTALRIGVLFIVSTLLLFCICLFLSLRNRKK